MKCRVFLLSLTLLSASWLAGAEPLTPVWEQTDVQRFDGSGPIQFEGGLHCPKGFALDFDVYFENAEREHVVFSQEGLLLLRMDTPSEGGSLSFFVNIDGALEPRLRSIRVTPGEWLHVTASWDKTSMFLRVNGETFRQERRGGPEQTGQPLAIGGKASGGSAGLCGSLRNVRVYDQPLTVLESILADSDTTPEKAPGALPEEPRFEFMGDEQSWQGVHAATRWEGGTLVADTAPPSAAILAGGLDYPVDGKLAILLRLASRGGKTATCHAATTAGRREVLFPLKGDGRMHTYVLWMDPYPEWRDSLRTLALLFDDDTEQVRLDFVRCSADVDAPPELEVRALYANPPLPRAGREFEVRAELSNQGGKTKGCTATLETAEGLTIVGPATQPLPDLGYEGQGNLVWKVIVDEAMEWHAHLVLSCPGAEDVEGEGIINIAAPRAITPSGYVPEPTPAKGRRLVGAHYCPLWKEGSRGGGGWTQIEPFPEREPLLGWYDEHNPEVTDWEVKWALDHGIDFFVYCWYRGEQGGPVTPFLGHAIHEGLFNARYGSQFKFCIMWENQFRGHWGVDSEEDLFENLFPYWVENYFRHPSYLVLDNKPLLFIYRPEYVAEDLGGEAEAHRAFDRMREVCREAGFDGLYILGEDRSKRKEPLQRMVNLGLDYSFSYCWPVGDDPDGPTAIAAQEGFWKARRELDIIPDVLTVSMGWDSTPWHPSLSKWRLTPAEFETACRKADAFMETLPKESLASRIVLLDNWNEFGEGHYIAPHRQYGFGYLDAVRAAFTDAPAEHDDPMPEDVELGPYDSLYAAKKGRAAEARKLVTKEGGDAPGLAAWWTFDEEGDEPFAWDYTGHGHGGRLNNIQRVPGHTGKALECTGGSVVVAASPAFAPRKGLTISCWLKTDEAGQNDAWFVNRIHDGQLDAGYRFGLSNGCLTWAVPQTTWSHHVRATEPLPAGRWVHVAGTCDNTAIRIYMDGRPVAQMERWGRVKDGGTRLVLGNYDTNHAAHFQGLLDEVRLYERALSGDEIQALSR